MSEEKKITADDIREAVKKMGLDTFREEDRRVILRGEDYVAFVYRIDDQNKIIDNQKEEIKLLKIKLSNEKKWGKIQAKQSKKETAREILGELDLFFKGTTFRQGYEFKKINEKLKEIAKNYDVGVDYEN